MKLIVCLDDRRGMMFAGRRQSRDKRVTEDIVRDLGGGVLYISPYSEKLLRDSGANLRVALDPIAAAREEEDAAVFLEDRSAPACTDGIDTVTVYLWGRTYPADLTFDMDLSAYRRRAVVTFAGNSHEKITKEIYTK